MTHDELVQTLEAQEARRIALRDELKQLVDAGDAATLAFIRGVCGPDATVENETYADTYVIRRPGKDDIRVRLTIYASGGQLWVIPASNFGPDARPQPAVQYLRDLLG